MLRLGEFSTLIEESVAASAIIGEYLTYRLLRMGISAQQFSDMHRAAMNGTSLKPADVVAVSSSGSIKDLLHVVQLAKEQEPV